MNKKGMTWQVILGIIVFSIAGVLLLLIFYGPKGGLATKISGATPEFDFPGITRPTLQEVEVPSEASSVYKIISEAFRKAADSSSDRCIIIHDEFPAFKDSKVVISSVEGGTAIWAVDENNRISTTDKITISGIKPCLVAGNDKEATRFLNNIGVFGGLITPVFPEYTEPASIELIEKETIKIGEDKYDLEDNGCCDKRKINLLLKLDSEHLCFLTTFDFSYLGFKKSSAKGIHENIIKELIPGAGKYNKINPTTGKPFIPFCEVS